MALTTVGYEHFVTDDILISLRRGCAPSLAERFGFSPSSCSSISLFFRKKLINHGFLSSNRRCGPRIRPGYRRSGGWRCQSGRSDSVVDDDDDDSGYNEENRNSHREIRSINLPKSFGDSGVISACVVGVLTGVAVVIFNTGVHEIRDVFWDGIPYRGVSWLREEPSENTWKQVILVPVCGGLIVSILNMLHDVLDSRTMGISLFKAKGALQPFLKAVAACFTLGTGNSLGPEGPSVEIGASIAKGVDALLDRNSKRKLSFVAAGSAAGISAGFNAAIAGCFFAVESILWPSPADSSKSLTNTTSMVMLSAVTASVLSEIGLGSEPTFKVVEYDFRSPSELPLYLLLGFLCGLVSLTLSRCTMYMLAIVDNAQNATGVPRTIFPVLGGLIVGLIALEYPEILYWGFQNVDVLLESQPLVEGLSVSLLLQLVAVKIVATSVCQASGLVGGYYAPSLFIGAATGMAYGKFFNFVISQANPILHLSFLDVASPQAYGLVGMAATLAGVCKVPLTSVLLLFELTQDYRIVLPLLGAVGFSSWITSGKPRKRKASYSKKLKLGNTDITKTEKASSATGPGVMENSLCLYDSNIETVEFEKRISVSQAMRTRYVTILMSTLLTEAISLMLDEKQSCAMIVDNESILIGLITLDDIQKFIESTKIRSQRTKGFVVSEICSLDDKNCRVSGTATPSMNLFSARMIMTRNGISQLPVVSELVKDHKGHLVGLLDKRCISLACSAVAAKECLTWFTTVECSSTE